MAVILCSPLLLHAQSDAVKAKPGVSGGDRVEARISELHAKLKITEAQEEQWSKVVQVMRENAAAMDPLVKARKEKGSTLNAVEDLKSYSKIAEVHAEGLNKFIPVFEVLYSGMTDEQKKIADQLFTKFGRKKARKG
jgi:hypothetical protein